MRIVNYFFLYSLFTGLLSCSAGTSMSGGDSKSSYREDLSVHRISYESTMDQTAVHEDFSETPVTGAIELQSDITQELDDKLKEIAQDNKDRIVTGYTIQVYSGSSREAANNAKDMIYRLVPEARPQIQYVQPNYKVKVGKFIDRLEAQKTYTTLKNEFPSVMIIPERFRVQ